MTYTQLKEKILVFFSTTQLGHFIKSTVVTFTGLFVGMIFASPVINELFKTSLPTINQLSDIWPVLLDSFYRALWATFLVTLGVYKYSSSNEEVKKGVVK